MESVLKLFKRKEETIVSTINYKYAEDRTLKELREYINKTYDQHYSQNKFQATEFVLDSGHGTGFCIGNILKYAQRYGKKGTKEDARKDLLKVIHYGIIALYNHDKQGDL
tara:strand:- start:44 stop:373 length:330 start_codon:yes stop_codon:yes gene_type:complete